MANGIKMFIGTFSDMNWEVKIELDDGSREFLNPRHDLANHSPDGFAWGYGGAGPAQLSLAIVAALRSDNFALRHYQNFKNRCVLKLNKDKNWIVGAGVFNEILDNLDAQDKIARGQAEHEGPTIKATSGKERLGIPPFFDKILDPTHVVLSVELMERYKKLDAECKVLIAKAYEPDSSVTMAMVDKISSCSAMVSDQIQRELAEAEFGGPGGEWEKIEKEMENNDG